MHSIHPETRSRLAALLRRTLIVDPNPHLADLLGGCMRSLGADEVVIEGDPVAAFETAKAIEPTVIVTEAFNDADPFNLIRSVRRSSLACRQAPILVLTTLATASAIGQAKEAGAHEFVRKPFAPRDMTRRLDHIAQSPRSWVERASYVGPDRRFFNSGGAKRRLSDRIDLIGQGVSASSLYLRR